MSAPRANVKANSHRRAQLAGHSGRPATRGCAAAPHTFREGQVAMARLRASAACPPGTRPECPGRRIRLFLVKLGALVVFVVEFMLLSANAYEAKAPQGKPTIEKNTGVQVPKGSERLLF